MPRKALRKSHLGISLNNQSAEMELRLAVALDALEELIRERYSIAIRRRRHVRLQDIVVQLNESFGQANGIVFTTATPKASTSLRPDGGLIYVMDQRDQERCTLVTEVKRQGTNDVRKAEGKPRQAQGNAIERLRKNMQGIDCLFAGEAITPFVCFGEGIDFASDSSILDRVATMNSFFPLNAVYVDKIFVVRPAEEIFKPTSLFFREAPWTPEEMRDTMWIICQRSIDYYDAKYGLRRQDDSSASGASGDY